MSQGRTRSSLWQKMPSDIQQRLRLCMARAASERLDNDTGVIFFRADDVGVPSDNFYNLVELFRRHQVPLTLAVVPTWFTRARAQSLLELCAADGDLWGWVQHGWRHCNHELQGKKQEFGPSRSVSDKEEDLRCGYTRLRALLGERLLPVFTPPWNRCDQETLHSLADLGYQAVSRNLGATPPPPGEITEYPVNVDLHTRKEKDAESGWNGLFGELEESLASGFCGFMIHHQRMNRGSYDFLDLLLVALKQWNHARLVHLGTLIREEESRKSAIQIVVT
jgi:hypothetical protein